MATFILDSFPITKSMGKDNFIGLTYHRRSSPMLSMWNILMGGGGEGCQMAMAHIRKPRGISMMVFLKMV